MVRYTTTAPFSQPGFATVTSGQLAGHGFTGRGRAVAHPAAAPRLVLLDEDQVRVLDHGAPKAAARFKAARRITLVNIVLLVDLAA